ncbi:MAG TPA: hypothetical protein VNX68_04760 [Nitrosopumilaceae archaeon]|jgi:hypothetical protein|nr:hypothetical protein [Nitrosopumilaceae archaeon]
MALDARDAIVMISAVGVVIVNIINAIKINTARVESNAGDKQILNVCGVAADKADIAAVKADEAATHTKEAVIKADARDVKLENLTQVTTLAADNVNGNLRRMTEKFDAVTLELAKQIAQNETLRETNKVLVGIASQRVRAEDRVKVLDVQSRLDDALPSVTIAEKEGNK